MKSETEYTLGKVALELAMMSNFQELEFFLNHLDETTIMMNQNLLRARCTVLCQTKEIDSIKQFYKIIAENKFDSQHHKHLQELWYNSHYLEHEIAQEMGNSFWLQNLKISFIVDNWQKKFECHGGHLIEKILNLHFEIVALLFFHDIQNLG